jgi:NAD(P)-dependent dehydrogenase (short-subunit alcohol dehydrogenase family)
MSLKGRGAVVTGGGRGIGAAVAYALARAGAAVVVAARTEADITRVAKDLCAGGYRAWGVRCDVTDPESVLAMARTAGNHLDHVDILVNNAGIAASAPVRHVSLEAWNRMFAVNATGPLLCTQALIRGMVERRWGRVINIASVASVRGGKYIAAYAASKHAVLGLTRCVAAEVAADGVTVNAVCPGYVNTDMTAVSVDRIAAKTGMPPDEALNAILETTPQQRLIAPDEVAHVVLSLCDADAQAINGQAIVMDGGGMRT